MENEKRAILHDSLIRGDQSMISRIPHADLHCHGITSAPFAALRELYSGIKTPPQRFDSFQAFNEYLRRNVAPAITSVDAIRFLVQETFERLISEGVCYTEISFDLTIPEYLKISMEEYIKTISAEVEKVRRRLMVCLEAGLDREIDTDKSFILLNQAVKSGGLGSIDLYGNELASPIKRFVPIYRFAKEHGLKRKAHVGELGTASDVKEAVELLDLQAVQHGVSSAQDPSVMEYLRSRGVALNVCPQSNLAIGVVDDIREHPIRELLQNGVLVTVNSDDFSLFGKSVGGQLIDLYSNGVCSEGEIAQVIDNGIQQSI